MTLTVKLLLIATLILSIIIPFGYYLLGEKSRKRYKRAIGTNVFFYFGAFVIAAIMMFGGDPVQAADTAENVASNATGFGYLAAALSTGLSCVGALGKSLIFVGLAEGVCLYGLIISFMILGKL